MRWAREHDFDVSVAHWAAFYRVPAALVKAIIGVESGFDPKAINPTDPGQAWGLMQMIPLTAAGLGYTGPMRDLLTNTDKAIQLGTKLLGQNLTLTRGSIADSVSAYNGGFRPSLGYGGTRPDGTYANQAYVSRVHDAYAYFQAQGEGGGSPGATSFRGDDSRARRGAVSNGDPSARPWWRKALRVVLSWWGIDW